jgi:energy-coupling factor transport system permease protein
VKGHFHPLAWLAWLAASAFLVVQIRNPFYLLILLLGALVVKRVCAVNPAILTFSIARIGALILLFSTLFHMLTVHLGRTILWTLPASWWLIGGPVTLESAFAGAINGLALLTLLLLFVTFSAVVPVHELSRLTPPALRDLGLILLIGLTYMPQTALHWQQIREAQAVRGHQIQGWRDWRPIVIPLLTGGLERSVNLAEAMVARGYGATGDREQPIKIRLLLLLGLASLLGGWVLSGWWSRPGWALAGAGVLIIFLVYRRLGRLSPRTTYRVRRWVKRDSLLALSVTLLLLPAGVDRLFGRSTLYYSPYPVVTLPPFDPLAGLALALIVAPAIITLVRSDDFVS